MAGDGEGGGGEKQLVDLQRSFGTDNNNKIETMDAFHCKIQAGLGRAVMEDI